MKEYPVLVPPEAVAVRVAEDPLPIVTGSTVMVGAGYTVTETVLDLTVEAGDAPEVTPVSVKTK